MKISTKLLYLSAAAFAIVHFANHAMAMDNEERKPQNNISAKKNISNKNEYPEVKKPTSKSNRKRFDPPAELSSDDLTSIFGAKFETVYPLGHMYEKDLMKRDKLRGAEYSKVQEALGLNKNHKYDEISTGAGTNASRVLLKDSVIFASLKEPELGQTRIKGIISQHKGKCVAVLDEAETRTLSTMGTDHVSVFGVYKLYDEETGDEVKYTHEVSGQLRPVSFRVAFSKKK